MNENGHSEFNRIEGIVEKLVESHENLTRLLARTIEGLGQLSDTLIQLTEGMSQSTEGVGQLSEGYGKLIDAFGQLSDRVMQLAEVQATQLEAGKHTDERLDRLAEAEQHTHERMDALIAIVDDLIRRIPPP